MRRKNKENLTINKFGRIDERRTNVYFSMQSGYIFFLYVYFRILNKQAAAPVEKR